MTFRKEAAIFAAVFAIATQATAHRQSTNDESPTGQIEPGLIIGSNRDQEINGWIAQGGGLYLDRVFENDVMIERRKCCYSIFRKGNRYTIAISEAVAINLTGGVISERITKVWEVVTPTGFEQTDFCQLLWVEPALSFRHTDSDLVIAYVFDGEDIREIRYYDIEGDCYSGD